MPKCKYCNQSITKFDKEICPFCGGKNPIDIEGTDTVDITQSIDTSGLNTTVKVYKSRKIFAFIAMFLGFFGIEELYIGNKISFLVKFAINALAFVGLSFLFQTFMGLWGLLLAFGILFIINALIGVIYLLIYNRKDSNGVFLK